VRVLLSVRLPGVPAGYRIRELVVVRLVSVRSSGRFVSRGGGFEGAVLVGRERSFVFVFIIIFKKHKGRYIIL